MRIHFEKSGGFTGMPVAATIDTNEMPPDEAARLLKELESSGLLEHDPDTLESSAPPTPDMITYELTLQVGSYAHRYCLTEADAPDSLQPLFRHLTVMARRYPAPDDPVRDDPINDDPTS